MELNRPEDRDGEPLIYPDPVYDPTFVDGAAFLYFDKPPVVTLAPAPVLAGGGFEIADWAVERRAPWARPFLLLNELWGQESDGCVEVAKILEPLGEHAQRALIAVPGDLSALKRSAELIAQAGFDRSQMRTVVDPICAAGELMNHIYLEMWLELGEDAEALYAYTATLFEDADRLEEMLQQAYLLRLAHLPASAPFNPLLLNNPRLEPFLLGLPGQDSAEPEPSLTHDLIAWEFFRQLLRPYLDPLTRQTAELIADCRIARQDETDALKRQTLRLAERVADPGGPMKVIEAVEQFIQLHVADEIADLLRLDASAKQQFLDSLAGDRAAWVAVLATAHGASTGSLQWTMGGAIGTIATLASKGYTTLAERRKTLKKSDYRLLYSVSR